MIGAGNPKMRESRLSLMVLAVASQNVGCSNAQAKFSNPTQRLPATPRKML